MCPFTVLRTTMIQNQLDFQVLTVFVDEGLSHHGGLPATCPILHAPGGNCRCQGLNHNPSFIILAPSFNGLAANSSVYSDYPFKDMCNVKSH